MAKIVSIKQHDTARKISDALTFNGAAIDLSSATVSIIIKDKEGNGPGKKSATIVNGPAGTVEYQLVSGDTATAGEFLMEWEVVLPGGGILTVPDNEYHKLRILPDLG